MSVQKFLAGFAVGAAIGAVAGILLAPKSGAETREMLGDMASDVAKRTEEVKDAIVRNHAVYFAAVGGAGALLSKCIKTSEVIAYDDLGTEAIRKLEVENFPVIVVIDSEGNNLYETATKQYKVD